MAYRRGIRVLSGTDMPLARLAPGEGLLRELEIFVEGGLTPLVSRAALAELGFAVALYANAALRGAVAGMRAVLEHLHEHGDTRDAGDLMIGWDDRQSLVRKQEFDRLDARYGADIGDAGSAGGERSSSLPDAQGVD